MIEAHGIARLSVAGHPEGHPYLAAAATFKALEAWRDWGRQANIRVDVVTQFCFESAPILGWIGELDARGIGLPVIVGLAGPATPGHADEIRAPLRHRQFDALAARPDRPLRPALDRHRAGRRDARPAGGANRCDRVDIAGFHLFPFGGLRKAANWLHGYPQETLRQMERRCSSRLPEAVYASPVLTITTTPLDQSM